MSLCKLVCVLQFLIILSPASSSQHCAFSFVLCCYSPIRILLVNHKICQCYFGSKLTLQTLKHVSTSYRYGSEILHKRSGASPAKADILSAGFLRHLRSFASALNWAAWGVCIPGRLVLVCFPSLNWATCSSLKLDHLRVQRRCFFSWTSLFPSCD